MWLKELVVSNLCNGLIKKYVICTGNDKGTFKLYTFIIVKWLCTSMHGGEEIYQWIYVKSCYKTRYLFISINKLNFLNVSIFLYVQFDSSFAEIDICVWFLYLLFKTLNTIVLYKMINYPVTNFRWLSERNNIFEPGTSRSPVECAITGPTRPKPLADTF